MNLRDWEYFIAVADYRHFGKAAEACHVTQPTLSAQLKKLEGYLGVELVERDNRHVWLTPVGQEMALRARRMLQEAEGLKQLARSQFNPLAGDIRLGAFPTLAPYFLPLVLPKVKKKLPELRVFLIEDKTQILLQQLVVETGGIAILHATGDCRRRARRADAHGRSSSGDLAGRSDQIDDSLQGG